MKKTIIALCAVAVVFAACNQQEQKHNAHAHEAMNNEDKKTENVMMQAMGDSMMAMHKAKMTGNPDFDFASMMIPHYEGAIVMAEAVVKNGRSDALIAFSKKVIAAQQKEISMLKKFLKTANQQPIPEAKVFKKDVDAAMLPMMDGMVKVKLKNDIDKDFVALMIPHHQSAVDMAVAYLNYCNNDKIRGMAEQIIEEQEEEISWLKTQ